MTMYKLILVAASLTIFLCGPALAGDPAAGQKLSQVCASCHGPDGNSASPEFPRIAGQHYDYLVKALKDYKSGARKNPIMAPMAEKLTSRDVDDLAAYFSSQKGLVTKH
jgi:cytochrome c553